MNDFSTDTKVPVLGDVPILGWLFRSRTESNQKTNLYIFLTPRVIKNPAEADDVFEMKKGEMDTIQKGQIKLYKGETE